jgi:DNA-binding beta-propeller fold protein YncE
MMQFLKYTLAVLVMLALTAVAVVWVAFGRGQPYPDLSGTPRLPEGTIEAAVTSDRPIGNATVSADGRIFYTIHPESGPDAPYHYEWVNGAAQAYPPTGQAELFQSPLGVSIDSRNRLWVIDPGNHGMGRPGLTAFDLATNTVVQQYAFANDTAPIGSFLQAMAISPDGRYIYIADAGFWAKRPAIVVYDTETETAWRRLQRHESLYPQNYLVRNQIRDMSFLGGILQMKTGIDGIAASRDGAWVYYAAMNHDTLYRVPASLLNDPAKGDPDLVPAVEAVGPKPLNDGLSIDDQGNVFITDIEHQAVLALGPDGKLTTVIKDSRIRWADALSFGPDGWLYLSDSAIPELVLQSAANHAAKAPYYV